MADKTGGWLADRVFVPEADVRSALARILASTEFARSKRVGLFLRFAAEEVVAGRGDRLKAFSIAREVYGRDESFDPRSDTIVRVEAGRLRRRLAAYYEGEGRDDPVRIALPKGGYAPTFNWIERDTGDAVPETPTPAGAQTRVPGRNRHLAAIALLAALAMALLVWIAFEKSDQSDSGDPVAVTGDQSETPTAFLAVLPLATLSDDPMEVRFAAGLVEAIVTDLAKLSGLSVMAHASLLELESKPIGLGAIRDEFGATHALRGSLERDDGLIRVNVQLVDIAKSSTIWAERLDGEIEDPLALQDDLAERVVDQLAVGVSPEEQTLLKRRHSSNAEALALYRQAFRLIMPPNDMERILAARHMFQRVVDVDPEFAGGYAGMSFSHSVTVLFFKAEEPDAELKTGIEFALKAIEVDPQFGMGYVTLAFAYAISGRKDEALFNARRAVAVQPGDAFTQFVFGLSHMLAGNSTDAVTALLEAIRLDPAEPRTPYRNVLATAYFMAGEYAPAVGMLEENRRIGGPVGPHMEAYRAAAYAELGNEEKASSIVEEMIRSYPDFPVERWLARWLEDLGDLERTMEHLYRHGWPRK